MKRPPTATVILNGREERDSLLDGRRLRIAFALLRWRKRKLGGHPPCPPAEEHRPFALRCIARQYDRKEILIVLLAAGSFLLLQRVIDHCLDGVVGKDDVLRW